MMNFTGGVPPEKKPSEHRDADSVKSGDAETPEIPTSGGDSSDDIDDIADGPENPDEQPAPRKRKRKCAICGAKKRNGETCFNPPMRGRSRCRLHGGKIKRGVENALWKDGRQSRAWAFTGQLGKQWLESYQDPELLSHRKYVALFDMRVRQLAKRLYTGESGTTWRRLQDAWDTLENAQGEITACRDEILRLRQAITMATESGNDSLRRRLVRELEAVEQRRASATEIFGNTLKKFGTIIEAGNKEEIAWRELLTTAHEAATMQQRENRRLAEERQMIPLVEVMQVLGAIYYLTKQHAEATLTAEVAGSFLAELAEMMQQALTFDRPGVEMVDMVDGEVESGD